ncbi:MAG: hypothetical protein HYX55_06350 [Chloroflexi bacterium]|nr:hypothetical protein [Chloroflexota bacterium]
MATVPGPWPSRVLWLSAVLPALAGLVLLAGSLNAPVPESYGFRGFSALFALSFGSIGAFVISRRPGNRVGTILLLIGIISGLLTLQIEYANVGLIAAPGSLPGAIWMAWLGSWSWVPIVILAGPVLLSVYPDGRFVSNRWRGVAWFGVAIGAVMVIVLAFEAGPLNNFAFVDNPVGILSKDLAAAIAVPTTLGLVGTLTACGASLFVRFRTADRDGRQQLKWFAAATFLLVVAGPLGFSAGKIGQVAFIVALCAIPLATGLSVLRYGLYEIDTVINRAIVYGLLTAILAGLYTASVGLMQRVSKIFTGADTEAAVVLTTLLVVTAFTPVKGWLQARVDRRFKESRDPGARLSAFVDDLQASFARPDTERTLRRLLRLIVEACDLQGARIELERPGSPAWVETEGEPIDGDPVRLGPFALGDGRMRLLVGPPKRRPTLSTRDRSAVEAALAAVAAELG